MGYLTNLQPTLGALPPRIARTADAEGHSVTVEFWRSWYKLARWKRLRLRVFLRDLYTCQRAECGRLIGDTSQLVADHKEPHRGDAVLFWEEDNIQTLCAPCHNRFKQSQERADRIGGLPSGSRHASPGRMARPDWFRRVHVPLTVVCGPPGAGKSTYVRHHAGPDDRIICFDEIATQLIGRTGPMRTQAALSVDQIADILRVRNEALGDLMRVKAKAICPAAWLILTEPKAEHRTWWAETLGARIVVMPTPAALCRERIAHDAANGDIRGEGARRLIDEWWRVYRPAEIDVIG